MTTARALRPIKGPYSICHNALLQKTTGRFSVEESLTRSHSAAVCSLDSITRHSHTAGYRRHQGVRYIKDTCMQTGGAGDWDADLPESRRPHHRSHSCTAMLADIMQGQWANSKLAEWMTQRGCLVFKQIDGLDLTRGRGVQRRSFWDKNMAEYCTMRCFVIHKSPTCLLLLTN